MATVVTERGKSGLAVATLLSSVPLMLAACGHSGGDPGGRVLRELQPVESAIPTGSSMVAVHSYNSSWTKKCPDNSSGQSGWSEVRVNSTFVTALPPTTVVDEVGAVLERQGWTRHDTIGTPGQGTIAHWTKDLGTGKSAQAFAYPVPAGSDSWFVTATWEPPGFALPGC